MSEPGALSSIIEPIGLVLGAVASGVAGVHWSWWFSHVASLLALPWKALLIPLSILGRLLFVVFAPVLYVLSYLLAGVNSVLGFIASLEPLYTFFGVAAFIGVIAGVILAVSSAVVNSYLGIQETPSDKQRSLRRRRYIKDDDLLGDDSSSGEADWQWLETSPVRRRPASGLLSQTIHEEDGSSDEAL